MKRKLVFFVCLIFIFSVFCANFSAAVVEDNTVQPRFTFIWGTSVNLAINSGTVNYTASLNAYPDTVSSTKISLVVQRRKAGSSDNWVGVKTISKTGSTYCVLSGSMAATKGYEYRAKATYTAYGSYAETTINYSRVSTYN